MTHASLFSGIGGFDLAAEWMGWENLFHCEWNPFGQKILKHHFPNSISYNDITKTDFTIHKGSIDILTGGFPCQPYSTAGKRLGKADERHLFPEMLRCIKEVKPRWVVGENVRGLVSWNEGLVFHEVYDDLEREGYEVQSFLIPAAGVNAPHQRYRIWFVAYNPANSDLHGQFKEWGYDRCSKNADGCEKEKFGTTNSKDINGCDTYRNIKKQYGISTGISVKGIYETNKTSDSKGFCRMDKNNRESETSIGEDKLKTNKNRALVQDGQTWIQLSDNRGLEYIKDALSSSNGIRLQDDISRVDRMERDATNYSSIGFSTKMENGELGWQFGFTKCDERDMWHTFPTEPPIRGGNDGIPEKLDSITIPKWRNESIKAYGNAIVPQVAFQIFKAINEFETLNNSL